MLLSVDGLIPAGRKTKGGAHPFSALDLRGFYIDGMAISMGTLGDRGSSTVAE